MKHPDPMDAQRKTVIWREWEQGTPMSLIARLIEKPPATAFSYLRYHGGIRPRPRRVRASSLSGPEREEISRGLVAQQSLRTIARTLHRSPSTISREVIRNGGVSRYRALDAALTARKAAMRPIPCLLATYPALRRLVARKLSQEWSPQQISSWLKRTYAGEDRMCVSHETIYRSLFIQTRGLFRKELRKHLRTKRLFRHAKTHHTASRGAALDGLSIRERPAEVEDRAVPGHWEGDLICGSHNSYIATLVERKTRFTMLIKVNSKETKHVVSALSRHMSTLPRLLQQSVTWDRGSELTAHHTFTMATRMKVYFCDPRSPWQRGTNENTNGLLRQYFPKGSCLSGHTQSQLNKVAARLNNRPRKTLGFYAPAEKLAELLR